MRFALFVAVVGLVAPACKGEPFRPDAQIDGPPADAYKPPWFFPAPGAVKNWDIQLTGYNFSVKRDMIVVDLWDVVPTARTITYDDASTVAVPAGSQPTAIATLEAAGTTIICHVGMGAMKLSDPDAMKFPGYEASPPNRPTAVKAGSSIGWSTPAGANERFVDFRIPAAAAVLKKRIAFAKSIGCDGIAAYRNDAASFNTEPNFMHGFSDISSAQQTTWITDVAKAGHDIMISVGGRGGHAAPNVDEIASIYDWLMPERCTENDDCDAARRFIANGRALFGLEYTLLEDGVTPNAKATVCMRLADDQVDGIIKTAALDSNRDSCP